MIHSNEILPIYGVGAVMIEQAATEADEDLNRYAMRAVRLGNFLAEFALNADEPRLHLSGGMSEAEYPLGVYEPLETIPAEVQEIEPLLDMYHDRVISVEVPGFLIAHSRDLAQKHDTDIESLLNSGFFFREELLANERGGGAVYLQGSSLDGLVELPHGLYQTKFN